MANTAKIHIHGEVPFFWMNDLSTERKAVWASYMLAPTSGLRVLYAPSTDYLRPNADGSKGQTAWYEINIDGTESIWPSVLRQFIEDIESCGGSVSVATYADVDNGGRVTDLLNTGRFSAALHE